MIPPSTEHIYDIILSIVVGVIAVVFFHHLLFRDEPRVVVVPGAEAPMQGARQNENGGRRG